LSLFRIAIARLNEGDLPFDALLAKGNQALCSKERFLKRSKLGTVKAESASAARGQSL